MLERGNILSLCFFHKIHLGETRPLVKSYMPKVNLTKTNTRAKFGYVAEKYKGANFEKSFFPNTQKLWTNLSKNTQVKNLPDFKLNIKQTLKPPRYKHFSKGSKLGNCLLTRIRVGKSNLNQHQFSIGLSSSPECLCHFYNETPIHYFLACFLYLPERRILFELVEHYVPNFQRLNRKQKFDILLRGISIDNPDIISTNIILTKAVQKFIISTKRFS